MNANTIQAVSPITWPSFSERAHFLYIVWITFPYHLNNGESGYTKRLGGRV